VPNGAICYSAKWGDLSLGAKRGDYNIMPIGAISGSWSSCISCTICIKSIFFLYSYLVFDFYVVSVVLLFLSYVLFLCGCIIVV